MSVEGKHRHQFNRSIKSVDNHTGAEIIVEQCSCGAEQYRLGDNNSPVVKVVPDRRYLSDSPGAKSLQKGGRLF